MSIEMAIVIICAAVIGFLAIICVTVLVSDWISKLCRHEWEQADEYMLMPPGEITDDTYPYGKIIVLRCRKCGDVKCRKFTI